MGSIELFTPNKCEICNSDFDVQILSSIRMNLCRYCRLIATKKRIRNKFDAIVLSKIMCMVMEHEQADYS
jgi:hypothetical protein